MMKRSAIAICGAAVLAAAPAEAQDPGPVDPKLARDEAAIIAAIHRIETAWRAGEGEDIAVNFAPDGVLISFGDRLIEGRGEIQAYYDRVLSQLFVRTELGHLEVDLRFLTPDSALATYEATIGPTTDAARPACSPATAVVLHREADALSADGNWVVDFLAMTESPGSDCVTPGG